VGVEILETNVVARIKMNEKYIKIKIMEFFFDGGVGCVDEL